jgi:hypothetical protein
VRFFVRRFNGPVSGEKVPSFKAQFQWRHYDAVMAAEDSVNNHTECNEQQRRETFHVIITVTNDLRVPVISFITAISRTNAHSAPAGSDTGGNSNDVQGNHVTWETHSGSGDNVTKNSKHRDTAGSQHNASD